MAEILVYDYKNKDDAFNTSISDISGIKSDIEDLKTEDTSLSSKIKALQNHGTDNAGNVVYIDDDGDICSNDRLTGVHIKDKTTGIKYIVIIEAGILKTMRLDEYMLQPFIDAVNDGSYVNKYNIGDTVCFVDFGEYMGTIEFILAGENLDELADGSGKAKVTLVAKYAVRQQGLWNPKLTDSEDEGTGVIGGYEKSQLNERIESLLTYFPTNLKNEIKEVNKSHCAAVVENQDDFVLQTSKHKLWALSGHEVGIEFEDDDIESGTIKYPIFTDDSTRKRTYRSWYSIRKYYWKIPIAWWLRSAYYTNGAMCVNNSGVVVSAETSTEAYTVFGFCI